MDVFVILLRVVISPMLFGSVRGVFRSTATWRCFGRAASKSGSLASKLQAARRDIPLEMSEEPETPTISESLLRTRANAADAEPRTQKTTKKRVKEEEKPANKQNTDNSEEDQSESGGETEDGGNRKGPSQASIKLAQRQKVKLLATMSNVEDLEADADTLARKRYYEEQRKFARDLKKSAEETEESGKLVQRPKKETVWGLGGELLRRKESR